MTRKKIEIYCTEIWANNNKTQRRRHPRPMSSPLDPGCTALPQLGRQTDRRTSHGAGTNVPLQSINPGNVQRNTPTGTWSAWKRTQEDPARLEWVQTAARHQQSHLLLMQGCQLASAWHPGSLAQAEAGKLGGGASTPS